MARWPDTPVSYPDTLLAYPGVPAAYPGAGAKVFPAGGSSFVPSDITGLKLDISMLDAASYTESGGTVSEVLNRISDAPFAEATNKPAYSATRINGRPGLDFDGSNDILKSTEAALLALFTDSAAFTIIVVGQTDVADASRLFFGFGNTGQATASSGGFGTSATGSGVWTMLCRNAANTIINVETVAATVTDPAILAFVHTTTTGQMFIDNGAGDPDPAGAATYSTTTPNQLAIGCIPRSTSALFLNGGVGAILGYDSALNTTQLGLIHTYLSAEARWGAF